MSESFILYTSYYAIIEGLTDAQLGQLTRAIFRYARDGEVVALEPVVQMAFAFIKDNIDRNADKYQQKCERNRENIRKRWEKKKSESDTNVYDRIPSNTNVYEGKSRIPYDNDSGNDNDNDVTPIGDNNKKEAAIAAKKNAAAASSVSSGVDIDYSGIKAFWNEEHDRVGSSMRRVTLMTASRKEMVRTVLRTVGCGVDGIYDTMRRALSCYFLNQGQPWATFEWLMKPDNFLKVMEGNYDKKAPGKKVVPKDSQPSVDMTEDIRKAQALATKTQASKDEEKRRRLLDTIRMVEKNPRSSARKMLESSYKSGELERLGIEWKP